MHTRTYERTNMRGYMQAHGTTGEMQPTNVFKYSATLPIGQRFAMSDILN